MPGVIQHFAGQTVPLEDDRWVENPKTPKRGYGSNRNPLVSLVAGGGLNRRPLGYAGVSAVQCWRHPTEGAGVYASPFRPVWPTVGRSTRKVHGKCEHQKPSPSRVPEVGRAASGNLSVAACAGAQSMRRRGTVAEDRAGPIRGIEINLDSLGLHAYDWLRTG